MSLYICHGCYDSYNLIIKFNCEHGFCSDCLPLVFLSNSICLINIKNLKQNLNLNCLFCSVGKCEMNLEKLFKINNGKSETFLFDDNPNKNTSTMPKTIENEYKCILYRKMYKIYCRDCNVKYCHNCSDMNGESNKLEFLNTDSTFISDIRCNNYEKKISIYHCCSHNEFICSTCFNKEHVNCKYLHLDEYLKNSKSEYELLKSNFNDKYSFIFENLQKNFDENLENLNKQRKECVENFDKVIDRIVKIKDKYEETFTSIMKSYKKYYEMLEHSLVSIDKIVSNNINENLYLIDSLKKVLVDLKIYSLNDKYFKYYIYDNPNSNPNKNLKPNLNFTPDNLYFNQLEDDYQIIKTNYLNFNYKNKKRLIQINYSHKNHRCFRTLIGHHDQVWCLVQLEDSLLASGSRDKTIKLWSLDPATSYDCIQTLTGHTNSIFCLIKLENGLLVSGSWDKSIKLWGSKCKCDNAEGKNKKYECIKTLIGHDDQVWCLNQLENGLLASGSHDKSIKLWDPNQNYECIITLIGHGDQVCCLKNLDNGLLSSGSRDKTIKLWDPNQNYQCMFTISGHEHYVYCIIQLENGLIASASWDKTIKLWDPNKNYQCLRTVSGHTDQIWCLIQLENGILASGSLDKKIKLWDPNRNYECLKTVIENDSFIICLIQLDNGLLVSTCGDKSIKLFK